MPPTCRDEITNEHEDKVKYHGRQFHLGLSDSIENREIEEADSWGTEVVRQSSKGLSLE